MEDDYPIMKRIGSAIRRVFHFKAADGVTEEEIISMVSEGHEQGVLEESEAEMIHNIFELGDKDVSDIMTHRKSIIGIDANTALEEAAHIMLDERFSRYPVYEGDIDNVIGILHLKDVMRSLMNEEETKTIREIIREPYFVPNTQNVDVLFKEMQHKKVHMAVVIDEYGQTDGIVAMEDFIEEIVGNILDEYDIDEEFIRETGNHTYIMRGLTPLEAIEDVLDIKFEEKDFDTLNGLIISKLERIPISGETTVIELYKYRFEVISVENNMIQYVAVSALDK